MNLSKIIKEVINESILTEAFTIEDLKDKFVNKGTIDEETFEEIIGFNLKINYTSWLLKMVNTNLIPSEDVYQFIHYLEVFNKFKNLYPIKDINRINKNEEIEEFIKTSIKIIEQSSTSGQETKGDKNYVTPTEISRLDRVGISFLGTISRYQVFKIPYTINPEATWKEYREILGRCSGRGSGLLDPDGEPVAVKFCTIATLPRFKQYTEDGPMYVFFNTADHLSPYQFHYESSQYKDRRNLNIFTGVKIGSKEFKIYNSFFNFLFEKEGRVIPKDVFDIYMKPESNGIISPKNIKLFAQEFGINTIPTEYLDSLRESYIRTINNSLKKSKINTIPLEFYVNIQNIFNPKNSKYVLDFLKSNSIKAPQELIDLSERKINKFSTMSDTELKQYPKGIGGSKNVDWYESTEFDEWEKEIELRNFFK
jgi:hypothetical protein